MGLFNKMREPVFLKESNAAEKQLERLKALEPMLNAEGQQLLKQEIKNVECGIVGEKKIEYELRNSHMPMCILHDVYFGSGDLNAQIDYLVFTKKLCFVIECKQLYGNIEITNDGSFIRTMEFNGRKVREGIYSPITQNQRHIDLMKKMTIDKRKNSIMKFLTDKLFGYSFRSVVVLANPKTILNARYAKKEIKDQVIRADQLVNYIKEEYKQCKWDASSDKEMMNWANNFLKLHQEVERDYEAKYEQYKIENLGSPVEPEPVNIQKNVQKPDQSASAPAIEELPLYKELRTYRLEKSRKEKIKPYMIYNNKELMALIEKMPANKEELESVPGFGKKMVEKYGDDILTILSKYR